MANRLSILAVFPGLIAGLVGCGTKPNPNYCPGRNPDNNCTEPIICEDNSPCAAPTGVCDTQTMTCVQCTPAMASTCTGTSPICGSDDSCHGCTAHTDCVGSNACLSDGSCAAPDTVAYVTAAPGGTDNAMCSFTSPCTRVAAALATGRPYVKFHGTIDEAVLVNGGRSVTFLADPGAGLTRSTGTGAILTVEDDRTSLSIYDLSISNAPNSPSGIGCLIPAGAGSPSLSLNRVSITNNPGGGISTSGGSLTVAQSKINGNQGGGLSLTNGTFVVVGNAFFNNGGNTTTLGGISIKTAPNANDRLEFNSFALNTSLDTFAPAVQCDAGTFTAKNNIISTNRTPTPGSIQFSGTCAHTYSIVQPGAVPSGTQNSGSDPMFVDLAKGDLHLQAASPARRAADPSSDLTGTASRDIDGTLRVAPADIGAYQFR